MNSAKLETSSRLQRVYNCLLSGPKTTMQIIKEANVCAVNSIVSELRANNIPVDCKCIGKGKYLYSLKKEG